MEILVNIISEINSLHKNCQKWNNSFRQHFSTDNSQGILKLAPNPVPKPNVTPIIVIQNQKFKLEIVEEN